MKFETKKQLRNQIDDLSKTNKVLKNYIRYLKNRSSTVYCSLCKDKVSWTHKFDDSYVVVHYCPNCGRKLKGNT